MFRRAHAFGQIYMADFSSLTRAFPQPERTKWKYDKNHVPKKHGDYKRIKDRTYLPKYLRYTTVQNPSVYTNPIWLFAIQDRFSRFIIHACISIIQTDKAQYFPAKYFDLENCLKTTFSKFGNPCEFISDSDLFHREKPFLRQNCLFVRKAIKPAYLASLDSFFGIFQREFRADFNSTNLKRYIDYYNFQRPHSFLSGYSPACALLCGSEKPFSNFIKNTFHEDKKLLFSEIKNIFKHNFK
jgi:hypothetical protein